MKTLTQDRLAAAVSLLLILTLAAGSYYLAEIAAEAMGPAGVRKITHEPDYFVDGLALTKVNARGEPAFLLSAERMVHYPDDESSEFVQPRMVSLNPARPQVSLRAETARTDTKGDETELRGKVVLIRKSDGADPEMSVRSEHMIISTKTEIARTDQAVEILRGTSRLTGVGMEFDNAARHLQIDSRVRGTWQPAPTPR